MDASIRYEKAELTLPQHRERNKAEEARSKGTFGIASHSNQNRAELPVAIVFEVRAGAAIDQRTGLCVYRPRILPASPPSDPDWSEFPYSFYRGNERIYGVGISVYDNVVGEGGLAEHQFVLDFSDKHALEEIVALKQLIDDSSDDYSFLSEIARGLVMVFDSRTDNVLVTRCSAVTRAESLAACGIVVPADVGPSSNDEILLATTRIAAHPLTGAAP